MDLVADFSAVTGATEVEAQNWLEMAGFVLEDAVQLFFGAGGQGDQPQGSADNVNGKSKGKHSYDDPYSVFEDDDNVRLPDQVKRQKLVDTEAYLENQTVKKITSAFSSGKNTKNLSEKEKTLSEIFQAPLDIMTQTGFEEAKELAKKEDKWLLVNIQKDNEFRCHLLNRDFWRDECVKDMVMCSFTFWQKLDVTPEGDTYISYYKVFSFPHLAIIDPRTGAKKWEYMFDAANGLDKKKLAEKLQDFLGDNPTPSESKGRPGAKLAPYPQVQAATSSSNGVGSAATSLQHSGGERVGEAASGVDASEDPELAAAIRMSLLQTQQALDSNTDRSESSSATSAFVPETVFALPSLKSTAVSLAGFSVQEALSSSTASTGEGASIRAQFRLPGGSKATEKFCTGDDVSCVVRAIAKLIPAEDASKRFDIHFNFPRQNLCDALAEQRKLQDPDSAASVTLASVGVSADMVFFVTFL